MKTNAESSSSTKCDTSKHDEKESLNLIASLNQKYQFCPTSNAKETRAAHFGKYVQRPGMSTEDHLPCKEKNTYLYNRGDFDEGIFSSVTPTCCALYTSTESIDKKQTDLYTSGRFTFGNENPALQIAENSVRSWVHLQLKPSTQNYPKGISFYYDICKGTFVKGSPLIETLQVHLWLEPTITAKTVDTLIGNMGFDRSFRSENECK